MTRSFADLLPTSGCLAIYPPYKTKAAPGGATTILPAVRYSVNIFHQAELALLVLDAVARRGRAPEAVLWNMPLLDWPKGLLAAVLPQTRVLAANATEVPARGGESCTPVKAGRSGELYGSRKGQTFFHAHAALRSGVHAACRVADPLAVDSHGGRKCVSSPCVRILYLRRVSPVTKSWRNFNDSVPLLSMLERAIGACSTDPSSFNIGSGRGPLTSRRCRRVEQRVLPTPGGETPFCSQAALWGSADVVLTTTGAHLVGALFLSPAALLVEGVPYAFDKYTGCAPRRHGPSPRPPTRPRACLLALRPQSRVHMTFLS